MICSYGSDGVIDFDEFQVVYNKLMKSKGNSDDGRGGGGKKSFLPSSDMRSTSWKDKKAAEENPVAGFFKKLFEQ